MKALIYAVNFLTLFPSVSEAAETGQTFYHVRDEHTLAQVSKRAAMLILLNDNNQVVLKCEPQTVTEKATMTNKKAQ